MSGHVFQLRKVHLGRNLRTASRIEPTLDQRISDLGLVSM